MKQLRGDGVCLACKREVILVEDDEKKATLFHAVPLCPAYEFDGDSTNPEGTYAKENVRWPAAN